MVMRSLKACNPQTYRYQARNGAAKRWKEDLNTNETTQNIER